MVAWWLFHSRSKSPLFLGALTFMMLFMSSGAALQPLSPTTPLEETGGALDDYCKSDLTVIQDPEDPFVLIADATDSAFEVPEEKDSNAAGQQAEPESFHWYLQGHYMPGFENSATMTFNVPNEGTYMIELQVRCKQLLPDKMFHTKGTATDSGGGVQTSGGVQNLIEDTDHESDNFVIIEAEAIGQSIEVFLEKDEVRGTVGAIKVMPTPPEQLVSNQMDRTGGVVGSGGDGTEDESDPSAGGVDDESQGQTGTGDSGRLAGGSNLLAKAVHGEPAAVGAMIVFFAVFFLIALLAMTGGRWAWMKWWYAEGEWDEEETECEFIAVSPDDAENVRW